MLHHYRVGLGPSLESIITHATKRVFSSVDALESYPTSRMITDRQLDIVILAKVTSAMTTLNQKPGFFSSDADGNTSISVQLTFYTSEMVQLTSIMASGMGIASESWALSTGKKSFPNPLNLQSVIVEMISCSRCTATMIFAKWQKVKNTLCANTLDLLNPRPNGGDRLTHCNFT